MRSSIQGCDIKRKLQVDTSSSILQLRVQTVNSRNHQIKKVPR